jgi:hypothetical protein
MGCTSMGPRRSALSVVEADYRDQELYRGGARWIIGLSESGTLPSELPATTRVQHAGSHSVPG